MGPWHHDESLKTSVQIRPCLLLCRMPVLLVAYVSTYPSLAFLHHNWQHSYLGQHYQFMLIQRTLPFFYLFCGVRTVVWFCNLHVHRSSCRTLPLLESLGFFRSSKASQSLHLQSAMHEVQSAWIAKWKKKQSASWQLLWLAVKYHEISQYSIQASHLQLTFLTQRVSSICLSHVAATVSKVCLGYKRSTKGMLHMARSPAYQIDST